jgi:uncharacterized protein YegL
MLVMVAVVLVILFIAAAFAIDIAYMHATRAELRTATDAAARAASESLGRLQDLDAARAAARELAAANLVAGEPLELDDSDIIFGTHDVQDDGKFEVIENGTPVSTIRIRGRRTADSPSGSVPLFFGPLLGVTEFEPIQQATSCRLDRDIALVLDVSGSMEEHGRFAALTNALNMFLIELESLPQLEHVSLTVYNHQSHTIQEMTEDLDLIREAFSDQYPEGKTAIGLGLKNGLKSVQKDDLARKFAFKEIILMTDGNHNTGVNPLKVAPDAAKDGVRIHAITFSQDANAELMQEVAAIANGTYLHADTNEQLTAAFQEIARQIPIVLIE